MPPTSQSLSAEAQHVIDALESHLVAVVEHAKTASPGAAAVISDFAGHAIDALEAWGLTIRGDLDALKARVAAIGGTGSSAPVGSGV